MFEYRVIRQVDELPPDWKEAVAGTVEWFADEATMPTRDFIDRLCSTFATNWELDAYDSPAAAAIMKLARQLRRETGP